MINNISAATYDELDDNTLRTNGIYVHGCNLMHGKLTDHAHPLCTQSLDTAEQYAEYGLIYFFAPAAGRILDLTNPCTDDMAKLVAAAIEDGVYGTVDHEGDDRDEVDWLQDVYGPVDIVDSAEAYDNAGLCAWAIDKYRDDYDFIATPDGGIVLNMATMTTVTIDTKEID